MSFFQAKSKVAVVAVGGNALIRDNSKTSFEDQYAAIQDTVPHIVDLIAAGWTVVVTHGNGPQVGFTLQRSELARKAVRPVPMQAAVAETQGSIGYPLQQVMQNELLRRGIDRPAVTVVTQVVVDQDDPAFGHPSKPIGVYMDEATARRRQETVGWTVAEDSGRGWRRVVPSPQPQRIIELKAIEALVGQGFSVIAVGGGGIPVIQTPEGHRGVAAVIDKDLASSLLARDLKADLLLISTAVEAVCIRFGQPDQQALHRLTLEEARGYLAEGHFKAGSMKPKVEAAIAFVSETGGEAVITNPENLSRAVRGEAGTRIVAA